MDGSCRRARQALNAWLDGEGGEELLAVFEEHAKTCSDCKEFRLGLAGVQRVLDAARPARAKPDLADRIADAVAREPAPKGRAGAWKVIGGVAAVLVVSLGFALYRGNGLNHGHDGEFTARGGVDDVTGIRVFCVSGTTDRPVIQEVAASRTVTSCKVGDVLQFSATLPAGSGVECVEITGRDSSGRTLFKVPRQGSGCIEVPGHVGPLVNEPLPGGVKLSPKWEGRKLSVTAVFKKGGPAGAEVARDTRSLNVVGR